MDTPEAACEIKLWHGWCAIQVVPENIHYGSYRLPKVKKLSNFKYSQPEISSFLRTHTGDDA